MEDGRMFRGSRPYWNPNSLKISSLTSLRSPYLRENQDNGLGSAPFPFDWSCKSCGLRSSERSTLTSCSMRLWSSRLKRQEAVIESSQALWKHCHYGAEVYLNFYTVTYGSKKIERELSHICQLGTIEPSSRIYLVALLFDHITLTYFEV